ncbi:MAG: hypothetical protein U0263_10680 [Polyangiaceae bacterium]
MVRFATFLALFGLALCVPLACGIEEKGAADPSADAGTDADSGHSVSSSCFPPAKACPDGKGELTCVSGDDPSSGCLASTACAPCVVPHATAACAAGVGCAVGTCDSGWQDCNKDPSDGCEANVANDPTHCGDCNTSCTITNPTYVCIESKCVENPCSPPTQGNCDNDLANGCETDLTTNANNCGFCGNTCKLPHAKAACEANPSGTPIARCVVEKCDEGWADCDNNPANGCENNSSTDPSTCGGCGKKCNSTNGVAGCVNGECALLCNPGFGNCDNNLDNGCEVDLNSHVSHCGACGSACSAQNGSPACVAGKCTTGGCSTGYADCDNNAANGCETQTTNDPKHCGGCTTDCAGTANGFATCSNGACGVGCSPGYATCGSTTTCYDTLTDPAHCGSTCKACPVPTQGSGHPACSGGNCGITCDSPFSACGSACVDLKNDKANCGTCGKVCTAAQGGSANCVNGNCVVSCPSGVAICNNQCVDIYNDSSNCGQCGRVCGVNQQCQAGNCVCKPFWPNNCGQYCAVCCGKSDCAPKNCCAGLFCC